MSTSRITCAMAVAVALLGQVPGTAHADDLAGKVAAKLRDSGAMAGYRVKVRAKSGTVWLEGQVADAKQLAAAVGMAESTEGVERVVNRLSVVDKPVADPQSQTAFALPSSIRSLVSLPTPAGPAKDEASPGGRAATDAAAADRGEADTSTSEGNEPAPIKLTQAVAPAGRPQSAANRGTPSAPKAATRTAPPRPFGMPSPRSLLPAAVAGRSQAARSGARPQARMAAAKDRTVMRTGGMGEPMELPAPGDYGAVGDGQMVPGSMRITEGPSVGGGDGYAGGDGGGAVMGPNGMGPGGAAGPMAMRGTGIGMPPIPMRGDGPNMPNYAWPSYASYPNYAALQYPTQYSPTAWPYIGPFYPYPQVPLGWRRVSLEWDDGWWFLDFDDRHHHSHHR